MLWLLLVACVNGKVVTYPDTATSEADTDIDADGDGFPAGDDCDDADADVHPGADEHCSDGDDDCDGDPDANAVDRATWYFDLDGDAWGDPANTALGCSAPFGYVAVDGDCDDTQATVHPEAAEACNGVDDDCNGVVDDGAATSTWYRDADGDGWGDPLTSLDACDPGPGWVEDASDCDDTDATVGPGSTETLGDGVDADCDGDVDGSPYEDAGYAWTVARNVVAGHTAHGWLLTTAADDVVIGSMDHAYVGLTLVLATGAATPADEVIWQGSGGGGPLGDRVDAVCSDDAFWASTDYEKTNGYLVVREIGWDASKHSFSSSSLQYASMSSSALNADVDVRMDAFGDVWVVSCGAGSTRYMSTEPVAKAGKFTKDGTDYDTTVTGATCVASPLPAASGYPATAVVCDTASCDTRALPATSTTTTGSLATTSNPWTTGYTQANSHGDWLILAETTGGVTVRDDAGTSSWHLLDGYDVLDADAAWSGSDLVVHAAVADVDGDGMDDLVVAYGDPDVAMTVDEHPFVVDAVTRSAKSAAVEIDGTDVLLAASADDDVAWAWLSL